MEAQTGTLFRKSLPPGEVPPPVEPRYSVHFEADDPFLKVYEEVRALMGGASSTMQEVLRRTLTFYAKRNSPVAALIVNFPASAPPLML